MSPESRPFLEALIVRNEVYLAPAATFNDPFDLRPCYSLDAPAARQREDFLRMSRKFEPHLSEETRAREADKVMTTSLSTEGVGTTRMVMQVMLNEYIRSKVGIYCVAEDWSSVLMWAHYADQHRGVCIEFHANSELFREAQQVVYAQRREPINLYEDRMSSAERALLTKSSDWAYEREWRFLDPEHGPGVREVASNAIKSIIFGAAITHVDAETLKAWNQRRANPATLKRVELSQTEYALHLRKAR